MELVPASWFFILNSRLVVGTFPVTRKFSWNLGLALEGFRLKTPSLDSPLEARKVRAFDTQLAKLLGDPRKPKTGPNRGETGKGWTSWTWVEIGTF